MSTSAETEVAEQIVFDRRVLLGLFLSAASLAGLVFPPALGLGIAGIIVSNQERKRIATSGGRLRGQTIAWLGIFIGVIGCLVSLVLPGFVVYAWIYAIFHGGRLPFDNTGP